MIGRNTALFCIFALLLLTISQAVYGLEVFQGLEEMTARISRLKDKPLERLITKDGRFQPEVLIFQDVETGTEIWSLTFEQCKELANIERRCPWNCNGSIVSLIGNRASRDPDGKLVTTKWAGHNYLMNPDGSNLRKFFITNPDGSEGGLGAKFNIWDRSDPYALYFPAAKEVDGFRSISVSDPTSIEAYLVRVRVTKDFLKNIPEPAYGFPNGRRKIIQNISDDNKLCIQDVNGKSMQDMPSYYVVDLSKKPGEPGFVRTHTLGYGGMQGIPGHDPKNEYRVHGISISRDGKTVRWGYGSMTSPGETVSFSVPADNLNAKPSYRDAKNDPWEQYRSHPGTWSDGRSAYFSGPSKKLNVAGVEGGWGLWVRLPGKVPAFFGTRRPSASGGHVTWCGNDPDWFFAHVGKRDDWEISDKIVAGKADGSKLGFVCRPYDRRRGGKYGYDGIPRPNQSPDATKCWFHSSMLMPSDEFTGSFIAVFRRPHPPLKLSVGKSGATIKLTWTPHPVSYEVKGYHVYCGGPDQTAGWSELTDTGVGGTEFALPLPREPGAYQLAVTAEEFSRLESDTTSPVISVTFGKDGNYVVGPAGPGTSGWDNQPPARVRGFAARKDQAGGYYLRWEPSPEKDLRYYNLYFSSHARPEAVQARRIASPPFGTTEYLDWAAGNPEKLHYAITAVDRQGNESQPTYAEAER